MIETTIYQEMFDGIKISLRVWSNPVVASQTIIFALHGMGGHGGYYKYLAEKIVPHGVMLIAPDMRGHGHSTGNCGDLEIRQVLDDTWQILNYIYEIYPGVPLFILGESMGGCIVINFLSESGTDLFNLKGVILFSPGVLTKITNHISFWQLAMMSVCYALFPGHPIINLGSEYDILRIRKYSVRYIFELFKYMKKAANTRLAGFKSPLLIFHGSCDQTIDVRDVQSFYNSLQSSCNKLIIVPEGSHCLFNDGAFDDQFTQLTAFVSDNI